MSKETTILYSVGHVLLCLCMCIFPAILWSFLDVVHLLIHRPTRLLSISLFVFFFRLFSLVNQDQFFVTCFRAALKAQYLPHALGLFPAVAILPLTLACMDLICLEGMVWR